MRVCVRVCFGYIDLSCVCGWACVLSTVRMSSESFDAMMVTTFRNNFMNVVLYLLCIIRTRIMNANSYLRSSDLPSPLELKSVIV